MSTAYHLKEESTVFERSPFVGGLSASKVVDGYTFDYGPHIFYTRSDYINQMLDGFLAGNLIRHKREAYIFTGGAYVKYPFEANLHPLEKGVIDECIEGVKNRRQKGAGNFKEWILETFGEGIAKHYMVPYNQKIWKYDLSKMNLDWIAGRVPSPSVEEMEKGARGEVKKEFGPNAFFQYARKGGIGALADAFVPRVKNLRKNCSVTRVKPLNDGVELVASEEGVEKKTRFKKVFSSAPLPELVKIVEGAPQEVTKAAESLVFNSLVCVNLGVKREKISDKHWLYFPEEKYVFNRISFPMNFSPETTPKGRSSILTEVTYREKQPDFEKTKEKVVSGLVDTGILKEDDGLEVADVTQFDYAYVIYDLNHKKNVSVIHSFLKENNIIPIGRFGEWEYLNMDKSILSGKKAAEEESK